MQPHVARLFLSEAPRQLQAVRDAVGRRDHAALVWAAHRLKGAVGNFPGPSAQEATRHLGAMSESASPSIAEEAGWASHEERLDRLTIALAKLFEDLEGSV
jgi:HPt (histidine-containing phosphotransfer) domain-containing protein